ncbi:MAG TPA: hypothetical protein VH643_33025 [Gemmataceae bacterium]|jgi:hypothetical protein
MRTPTSVGCASIVLALLLTAPGRANIGPKWWGDRAAEPLGLKDVAITRETLTIDLRPLADVQPLKVEAIYHLNNAGPARTIELFFLTGVSGVRDFMVRLDDRLLESRELPRKKWPGTEDELPLNWQPPADMPGIDSDNSRSHIYRRPGEQVVLAFFVELPPGRSVLSAHYSAKAYGEDEDYPTVTWQFPYILAPAREWGSFGELDVTVYLPEAWQANSNPALEREGGVLHGHFATLPADCLALAVRQPMGPELQQKMQQTVWAYVGLYAFMVISGSVLCWWAGRLLGWILARMTSSCSSLWGVPSALLMPVGWAAALLESRQLVWEGILGVLAGQEAPYFHERFFLLGLGTLWLIVLALPLGFVLTSGGFRLSLQRSQRRKTARTIDKAAASV